MSDEQQPDFSDQPPERQYDPAAVALDEAGAEMYGREAWDAHINEGLKGVQGESTEFLHAFREHADPREAARAVHALCADRETIDTLAKSDPAEAFQRLRDHMRDVAELSDQDKLTMAAWQELRQKQIAESAKPTRTYVSKSASDPKTSDKLSMDQWIRSRNAEIAKKEER